MSVFADELLWPRALPGAARLAPVVRLRQTRQALAEDVVILQHPPRQGSVPFHELQILRLDFNQIDDAACRALATAFSEGGAAELLELHLSANLIGDAGATSLASQLQRAPKLRTLAFGSASGGNLIGDAGARELAAVLGTLEPRAESGGGALAVSLRNNRLTAEGEPCSTVKIEPVGLPSRRRSAAEVAADVEAANLRAQLEEMYGDLDESDEEEEVDEEEEEEEVPIQHEMLRRRSSVKQPAAHSQVGRRTSRG